MEDVDKEISEMKLFVCSTMDPFEVLAMTNLLAVERKGTIRGGVFLDTSRLLRPI
jgi:hypothetical protein